MAFLVLAVKLTAIVLAGAEASGTGAQSAEVRLGRADIVDRNGVRLATNVATHSLYAHPHEMSPQDIERTLHAFEIIFPEKDLEPLKRSLNPERRFAWIEGRVSPEQMLAVRSIGVPGLHFGKRQARIYPQGRLGSHLIGGVQYGKEGVSWAEIIGVAGVERSINDRLAIGDDGNNEVALSVEARLQSIVEEVLAHGVGLYSAKAGGAVLMDARSGEILSIASFPDFDPNNRNRYIEDTEKDHGPLFCIPAQGVYELGSTFKVFAAAQALELGLVDSHTLIERSPLRIGDRIFEDHSGDGNPLTVEGIIVESSNVGAARLALRIGKDRQREFLESLGFGEPTALEIAEAAIARPTMPARWNDQATATVSYGHGISVSLVHLASAYASLVNGGCKVEPTVLKAERIAAECERVISAETSRLITEILGEVVNSGTATRAQLDTVSVGGKTGTADKVGPNGYYEDRVIATFSAVLPVEDPQYVLVLMLDEPTTNDGSKWQRGAGNTAVPVAAEIISRISPFLLAKRMTAASSDADPYGNSL